MPIPLGSKGQPDFTEPIALMMDCHRRIEHFLEVLTRVFNRYSRGELDAQGREALTTALDYFASAAPRHTADEEQSLFPRMRACADPAIREAMAQMDQLEADHRDAEAAHIRLDTIGRRWLDVGRLTVAERDELEALLTAMTATYARHIRIEDQSVFVLARGALDAQALTAVGREMKQRRVDAPGRPDSRCAQRRRRTLMASDDIGHR